jgi:hypothetical protein
MQGVSVSGAVATSRVPIWTGRDQSSNRLADQLRAKHKCPLLLQFILLV